jgi:Transposase
MSRESSAGFSEGQKRRASDGGGDDGPSLGWPRRRQRVPLGSPALDASGTELLCRRVENEEADILRLIEEALSLAEEVLWAVDQPGGGAALLLALLWEGDQKVLYVPGISVDRARQRPTAR